MASALFVGTVMAPRIALTRHPNGHTLARLSSPCFQKIIQTHLYWDPIPLEETGSCHLSGLQELFQDLLMVEARVHPGFSLFEAGGSGHDKQIALCSQSLAGSLHAEQILAG
jgi:hypothetical protein